MKTRTFVLLTVLILVADVSFADAGDAQGLKDNKRFVAVNETQVEFAKSQGGILLKDNGRFKIYSCKKEVGNAKILYDDLEIFALDVAGNDAVEAESVGSLGYNGSGIRVAVVDSGYDYNHPDLASSYLGGYDYVNDDNDPIDDNGHGSHVSGIITADGINERAKGIAPEAGIIALKVLGTNGLGSLIDAADAVYEAVDRYDADIISLSLGSGSHASYCDNAYPYFTEAINYAYSKGINVVVASGNSGIGEVSLPACINKVFSVGKITMDLELLTGGYNPTIDIFAPGSGIYSTWSGGTYKTATGTSSSTPFVSGALSLLRQKNGELEAIGYENHLTGNAKIKILYPDIPYKVLDVLAAINALPEPSVCEKPKLQYSFANGQMRVFWQSQSGCTYNLKESTDLENWVSMGLFDGNNQILDRIFLADGKMRFFKLEVVY